MARACELMLREDALFLQDERNIGPGSIGSEDWLESLQRVQRNFIDSVTTPHLASASPGEHDCDSTLDSGESSDPEYPIFVYVNHLPSCCGDTGPEAVAVAVLGGSDPDLTVRAINVLHPLACDNLDSSLAGGDSPVPRPYTSAWTQSDRFLAEVPAHGAPRSMLRTSSPRAHCLCWVYALFCNI